MAGFFALCRGGGEQFIAQGVREWDFRKFHVHINTTQMVFPRYREKDNKDRNDRCKEK